MDMYQQLEEEEPRQKRINYHINQYQVFYHRLYYTINGCHLYDSVDEKQYLRDMQYYHALEYEKLIGNDLFIELPLPK